MNGFIEFNEILKERKCQAKILILGSYQRLTAQGSEESCEEILEKLKEFLIANGFSNTKLVKDWIIEDNIPPESLVALFREKSFHHIDYWAEILVFVFLKDANNYSVTRELSHMVDCSKEKCSHSIILRHDEIDLGSLIKGDISIERILESSFSDNQELYQTAFAGCFNILFTLESQKHTS